MELLEISRRTGIEPRRLRYAIYHTLVPGVRKVAVGRGSVRHFTPFEAFGISFAAMMLGAGLKREAVAGCMHLLCGRYGRETQPNDIPLYRAFVGRGPADVSFADGRCVRLRAAASAGYKSFDTGWISNDGRAVPTNYEPSVLITAKLQPLADVLRQD
jgi:hypothetical protein